MLIATQIKSFHRAMETFSRLSTQLPHATCTATCLRSQSAYFRGFFDSPVYHFVYHSFPLVRCQRFRFSFSSDIRDYCTVFAINRSIVQVSRLVAMKREKNSYRDDCRFFVGISKTWTRTAGIRRISATLAIGSVFGA